jgi:hypothetical protein
LERERKSQRANNFSDYAFFRRIGELCIEGINTHFSDMISRCGAISMRGAREDEWYPKYTELQEKHKLPTCFDEMKGFGMQLAIMFY